MNQQEIMQKNINRQLVSQPHRMRQAWDDRLFDLICNVLLLCFVIIVFYPLYFIVMASFSDPVYVNNGTFLLYPKGFTILGYQEVFANSRIWSGYFNTIVYTVGGTVFGTCITLLAGYAFSRKDVPGNGIIMKLFVFTMYFSGGTIPTYLVIQNYGLVNTRLLMIVLGSVSVYNIIIVRSFFGSNIPDELLDAARIDGCGNGNFFLKIVLPVSKAVIAVIVLYIAVTHWNSYFNALLYLTDSGKQPLQLYLREILLVSSTISSNADSGMDPEALKRLEQAAMLVKYSVIVVATAPILCLYPFVQKYFVKGVMIGSVKG